MKIAIVTDSTCDWPYADFAARRVSMVPLNVAFGAQTHRDLIDLSSEEFCRVLRAGERGATTSQPSPGAFACLFEVLYEQGFEAALCLHLAAPLSGTVQSASIAADSAPIDVRVIDTRLASSALGLAVDAACRLRDGGVDDIDELQRCVERVCAETRVFFVPETLDALVRGGRLAREAAESMGMLNVKALLTLDERGSVVFFDKARGLKGAVARCVEQLEAYADEHGSIDVRYARIENEEAAARLAEALDASRADIASLHADTCGATIATHLGLGAWCLAMAPRVG